MNLFQSHNSDDVATVAPLPGLPPAEYSTNRSESLPILPFSEAKGSELERLRDILFGSQARTTERRLEELSSRLETWRYELTNLLSERVTTLNDSLSGQITAVRKDLTERLNKQTSDQMAQLRQLEQKLSGRLESQTTEQTAQLHAAQQDLNRKMDEQGLQHHTRLMSMQQEFNDKLEALTADFLSQLNNAYKDLNQQVDQLHLEKTERMQSLQIESRQRNDSLRQEFLSNTATLEQKKVSRHQLAQLLLELSQRMSSDKD